MKEKLPERKHVISMDLLIGYLLLLGVVLSITLIAAGVLWNWLRSGSLELRYELPGSTLFHLLVSDLSSFVAGQFYPRLLVSLGIVVLMLTPYARVLASILYFAIAGRNWKYVAFTSVVFLILTYSLFLR